MIAVAIAVSGLAWVHGHGIGYNRALSFTAPVPMNWWGRWLCPLGFHRSEFIFGWVTHLDTGQEGYEGSFRCPKCGLMRAQEVAKRGT